MLGLVKPNSYFSSFCFLISFFFSSLASFSSTIRSILSFLVDEFAFLNFFRFCSWLYSALAYWNPSKFLFVTLEFYFLFLLLSGIFAPGPFSSVMHGVTFPIFLPFRSGYCRFSSSIIRFDMSSMGSLVTSGITLFSPPFCIFSLLQGKITNW